MNILKIGGLAFIITILVALSMIIFTNPILIFIHGNMLLLAAFAIVCFTIATIMHILDVRYYNKEKKKLQRLY